MAFTVSMSVKNPAPSANLSNYYRTNAKIPLFSRHLLGCDDRARPDFLPV